MAMTSEGLYVDRVTVVVKAFDGYPEPKNLKEAWVLRVPVSARIDRDALAEEIQATLRGKPHVFSERRTHFSWGAAAGALEFIVEVGTGISVVVITEVGKAVYRRLKPQEHSGTNAEMAGEEAKSAVATAQNIEYDTITVEEVQPLPDGGFRVRLSTPRRRCEVDVDQSGDSFRIAILPAEPNQESPSS
jgi:hypothetical protein